MIAARFRVQQGLTRFAIVQAGNGIAMPSHGWKQDDPYRLDKDKLKTLLKIVEARRQPRCDLPERLDPPRPRKRSGLDAALRAETLDDPFGFRAA